MVKSISEYIRESSVPVMEFKARRSSGKKITKDEIGYDQLIEFMRKTKGIKPFHHDFIYGTELSNQLEFFMSGMLGGNTERKLTYGTDGSCNYIFLTGDRKPDGMTPATYIDYTIAGNRLAIRFDYDISKDGMEKRRVTVGDMSVEALIEFINSMFDE